MVPDTRRTSLPYTFGKHALSITSLPTNMMVEFFLFEVDLMDTSEPGKVVLSLSASET